MANHSSGDSTVAIYETDQDGNALLLLRDGGRVEQDGEITITYGDKKGACEMLFSYGFIEEGLGSARELFLDLSIPEDDPLGRAKAAVADCAPGFKIFETAEGLHWEGDYIWPICVNEEDGLQFQIQQTVEGVSELKASWKGLELTNFRDFRDTLVQDRHWDVFQLRAVSILQDRIASQLTALYGSDDEVNAVLHGQGTAVRERPWQLAVQLRTLEGELLEKAYGYFEDKKAALVQSESVVAYLGAMADENEGDAEDFSQDASPEIEAHPVSPPVGAETRGEYTCYVDYKYDLYSIYWSGSMQYPEMSGFPRDSKHRYVKVELTPEMSKVWSGSSLIGYGADAVVRCSHKGRYPVVKLAHPHNDARARIQHEHRMIQEMGRQQLPIPGCDDQPLSGDDGVFGYHIEPLFALTPRDLLKRQAEVREAVNALHNAGFCHGDLSISNIMQDRKGKVKFIDFGFAGKIGDQVPDFIPAWVYHPVSFFTTDNDERALNEMLSAPCEIP
ncbi:hypothetical protein MBLNU459_g4133t1 [Dothideomycetes sp. NU459]